MSALLMDADSGLTRAVPSGSGVPKAKRATLRPEPGSGPHTSSLLPAPRLEAGGGQGVVGMPPSLPLAPAPPLAEGACRSSCVCAQFAGVCQLIVCAHNC